jgi:hypothetical protein
MMRNSFLVAPYWGTYSGIVNDAFLCYDCFMQKRLATALPVTKGFFKSINMWLVSMVSY